SEERLSILPAASVWRLPAAACFTQAPEFQALDAKSGVNNQRRDCPQKLWITLWVMRGKPPPDSAPTGLRGAVGFLRSGRKDATGHAGRMGSAGRLRCQFHGTGP